MKKKLPVLLFLSFFLVLSGYGEVFLLGGKRASGGKGVPGTNFSELFNQHLLMKEEVAFNGVDCELEVRLIKLPIREVLEELKNRYPGLPVKKQGGNVLIWMPEAGKYRERVLLIGSDILNNVTSFSVFLPVKRPVKPVWPDGLPLPADCEALEGMVFKKSGVRYGAFANMGIAPEVLLRSFDGQLRREGFQPVSGEAADLTSAGRGEVYLRQKPRELLWVNFNENGGVVTLTPLK